ncbi:hypothetical protein Tco_0418277 [Tanacetum coccineum]
MHVEFSKRSKVAVLETPVRSGVVIRMGVVRSAGFQRLAYEGRDEGLVEWVFGGGAWGKGFWGGVSTAVERLCAGGGYFGRGWRQHRIELLEWYCLVNSLGSGRGCGGVGRACWKSVGSGTHGGIAGCVGSRTDRCGWVRVGQSLGSCWNVAGGVALGLGTGGADLGMAAIEGRGVVGGGMVGGGWGWVAWWSRRGGLGFCGDGGVVQARGVGLAAGVWGQGGIEGKCIWFGEMS